ncbi:MAG: flagellar biosynthesis protein FlhF [Nitrospiraceae bacterium]|nr:MAG: flagellar biosynthesis protein FlhF [Nitrospiraceae bacterium]
MKIKTYRALTMQDAIRSIKEELGPDAVILSTKQVRTGGHLFGLFSRPVIEVTAGIDHDIKRTKDAAAVPTRTDCPSREGSVLDQRDSAFLHALRASMDSADADDRAISCPSPSCPCSSPRAGLDRDRRRHLGQVKAELRRLHARVRSTEWIPGGDPKGDSSAPEATLYRDLVAQGVEPSTAEALLNDAKSRLPQADLGSPVAWRRALERIVIELTKVSGPLLAHGDQKIALFIGATGVGKTTTIAKLAAHYRTKEKRAVSVITLDTYRMASVEQLRAYAKVLGVPLDIALTRREALEGIRRRRAADVILIDTAGRSPLDAEGLNELKELLTAGPCFETHLVLSATTSERDLLLTLTRYARLPIDRLLFTKLDETTSFGGIFETALRTGLALSYFSTGQRVPDDLEPATPERLANLLLGGPLKALGRTQTEAASRSAQRVIDPAGRGGVPRHV